MMSDALMMSVPLVDRATTAPHTLAIQSDGLGGASWEQLRDEVLRLAAAIRDTDVGPRRRVLVMAHNRPATLLAHVAILLGEAAAVPVNYRLTATEVAYILAESGARLAFVDTETEASVRAALEMCGATAADVSVVRLPDRGITADHLDEFIGDRMRAELRPEQPVLPSLLFTSGTTGKPKAVQLPPTTVGAAGNLAGFVEHISAHRLAKLGTHLAIGPLYHNGPLNAVRLLLAGVPVIVHHHFDAEKTLAAIDEHAIESSIMVPTHFIRMLALPADVRDRYDVSSIRQVAHTGGKCPVDVKHAMIDWWGPVLSESYGGTESGSVCSINSIDWLEHPGSVGRAIPPFEAIVIGADGAEAPANTEGALYFRDTTGRGIVYEDDPVKTANAHIAPGVFTLGEIGYIDDEGYVFITDRFSDMVVSGGVNIYPAEAEQTLMGHPEVLDVACVGVADEVMGERLVALVQRASTSDVTADELSRWCRNSIASYKCPREFHFVDEVPRNPMGKLDKRSLRLQLSSGDVGSDRPRSRD
jgi:long-chain acyl-CoA synthetase